ncbi:proline iminopeptidase-family hydrolase [Hyphomonas johnsonii]|uniref:Proline-specific peptidase n=1 Tax=Hyphomonas johnsonii MHS-2 TaxID=1280950 RepID=A0A059FFW1_9PROT|nr:proline iminopeptidase-family hydrolase [Hyphomonas johnsonii]KCZ89487.1 proline-specific peptidase [Hyphomonas johnsonii MHS-2]
MRNYLTTAILALVVAACSPPAPTDAPEVAAAPATDATEEAGVRMIPITTPKGDFKVWTKQVGDNPRIKVLLLHGGPGADHEAFKTFEDHFPQAGIAFYYYDQLDSWLSDQPNDPDLWTIEAAVSEVDQVREALGLDRDNFYLYGQSWGGLLAMEYALAHQDHLKGVIISNMIASIPAYVDYSKTVLQPRMDPAVLREILDYEAAGDFENPRYMELLMNSFYTQHILRRPVDQWPPEVLSMFEHLNGAKYVAMQGPSEMSAGGTLVDWDRFADLHEITVPTLVIGSQEDTMDPAYMARMADEIPHADLTLCPDAGHFVQYDNPDCYFGALTTFIKEVDSDGVE